MGTLRVAVDVGGTFTDAVVYDPDGEVMHVGKVPSTADPIDAILDVVRDAGAEFEDIALFSHGTTVATNALITRNLPRAAMVTTRGFRDVIEIRRGTKLDLWDTYNDVAAPYVRRRDRLEVSERMRADGTVASPLDEEDALRVVEQLRALGDDLAAVAICFINSYANPAHELRMREIIEAELPDLAVSTSAETLPEMFEHERFSTAVVNAVLQPRVGGYVGRLGSALRDEGYDGDLLLLHSGGGVLTAASASKLAARLAASGLAAGAIASREIGLQCGFENTMGFDMGGTSTDISLTYDGELRMTNQWWVEYGYPICFPSVDVVTIGAGGGSLAWIDEAGALHNGPQSAGANPGPACYGQGNQQPTNTDANLVLGRLGEELIGGAMKLDRQAAVDAVTRGVAEPLGLSLEDAARAILTVANANMADALRLLSIRRGNDPRDFAVVAFGGAGPLHGAALAAELGIPKVIVPPSPGATSALGCLLVDVRHDLSTMLQSLADQLDTAAVEAEFERLETDGRRRLEAEGVKPEAMLLQRYVDMRYLGQWRSVSVPVGQGDGALAAAIDQFHVDYEREHNFRRDDAPVEVYRMSVRAIGVIEKPALPRHTGGGQTPEPITRRPVWHDTGDAVDTPVYERAALRPGTVLEGPAILEQLDTTVLVPPGVTAEIDEMLNVVLDLNGSRR